MGYKWYYLPRICKDSLMTNTVRLKEALGSSEQAHRQLGLLLTSLSDLDCTFDHCPTYFQQALFHILVLALDATSFNSPETGKPHDNLSGNHVRCKGSDLNRLVKGLSGCGVSWNSLPHKIRWYALCCVIVAALLH